MRIRKAFTLIELMIAILLLGLVLGFLMGTLGSLKLNTGALEAKDLQMQKQEKMLKLIQEDVLQSSTLSVIEADKGISLEMQTSSSIHQINNPYVRWFLDSGKKLIIRSESAKPYFPPFEREKLFEIHLDIPMGKCNWFKSFVSNDKKNLLISAECHTKAFLLEVATPQYFIESKKNTESGATNNGEKDEQPIENNHISETK